MSAAASAGRPGARSHRVPLFIAFVLVGAVFSLVLFCNENAALRLQRQVASSLNRDLFLSERIVLALQRHYWQACQKNATRDAVRAAVGQIRAQYDEHGAVQFGSEMWNWLSLEEISDPFRYYPDLGRYDDDAPMFVLSYGNRLEQGRQLLARIAGGHVDYVSYPSLEVAFENRQYLGRYIFRDAARLGWDEFRARFPTPKRAGHLLATLNQWAVLDRLANSTYPDVVVVVEDDVLTVPDFARKFGAVRAQLNTVPDWEVVFLGTCLGIMSSDQVTENLYRSDTSRCFNAVMFRRSAAVKVLERGAISDEFLEVDWLFNQYIVDLDLRTYFVQPPLAYEQSKTAIQYPC